MYTRCNLTIDLFRDTLFTLLAAKENKFFTDSYRKDAGSSGFTLVSTSIKGTVSAGDSAHWGY